MASNCVAIYLDFENLALSAEQVFPKEEFPVQVEAIVDFAANKGVVAIKKAYANWNYPVFRKYQRALIEQGFDLIHLPESTVQGKSWADVRLTVAVLDDIALHSHIQTVVLGSQDTDFVPLVQAIKTKGLDVVVAGFSQFVGNLLKKNCSEFISLSQLFSPDGEPLPEDEEYDLEGLFRRFGSTHSIEEPIFMTNLKQNLLKLDPSFSERQLGYQSFSLFARSLVGKYLDRIERSKDKGVDVVFLKPLERSKGRKNTKSMAGDFLAKSIRIIKPRRKRLDIIASILKMKELKDGITLPEIIERTRKGQKMDAVQANRFVFQLYNAGVLVQGNNDSEGPLDNRKMFVSRHHDTAEKADLAFLERIRFLLSSRFPSISNSEITNLMND